MSIFSDEKFKKSPTTNQAISIVTDATQEHYLSFLNDISALQETVRAKDCFLMNLIHDIRNPLIGLAGVTELISQEENIKKIHIETARITKVIHILLNFLNNIIKCSESKTYRESHSDNSKFNFKTLLNDVVELAEPAIKAKNLRLKIKYDETLPTYLLGNNVKLARILLNLLDNAIKFTPKGTISITIKNLSHSRQTINLQIIVRDSGIGIPLKDHHHIFSKFTRLNHKLKKNCDGFGLGLSIVKQFLSDLGGTIQVSSKKGKGSSFVCTIPLKRAPAKNSKISENHFKIKEIYPTLSIKMFEKNLQPNMAFLPNESLDCSSIKERKKNNSSVQCLALLVEDNKLVQHIIAHQLSSLGCQVDIADTGKKALRLVSKKNYDVIFVDLELPDKTGLKIATEIRKKEYTSKNYTPLIALTAHQDKSYGKLCAEAGMDRVLTKPLQLPQAKAIIKKAKKIKLRIHQVIKKS